MSRADAGSALGLQFTGDPLPGLLPSARADLPTVSVERVLEPELDARWAAAAAPEVIFTRHKPDGQPYLLVEHDAHAGYRVWAERHGTHLITTDGSRLSSALPDGPGWVPLRLLAAQVLPVLAVLHAREVLHAAGVVVGDRVFGIVAASGTGKSTTTCNVIARGAHFFADDVLALEEVDGAVLAHPGTRLLNVHAHELEAIDEAGRARLGTRIGESDKVHLEPPVAGGPRPLSGLLFLERGPGIDSTGILPVEDVPSRLLGNAFLPYLDARARLLRQLAVMSAVAGTTQLARLRIAPGDPPADVGRRVWEWADSLP